jgi:hypothetical protein
VTIKLLGTAAGGGFPQWNCTCANCARLRNKTLRGSSRTQVQLACELEADHCVLVNASPDLHRQIEGPDFLCSGIDRHNLLNIMESSNGKIKYIRRHNPHGLVQLL